MLENATGKLYVGPTRDLQRRLSEHNDPHRSRSKYTAKHGPWRLVWAESYATRAEAMAKERFVKSRRSAAWIRRRLLGRGNPDERRG